MSFPVRVGLPLTRRCSVLRRFSRAVIRPSSACWRVEKLAGVGDGLALAAPTWRDVDTNAAVTVMAAAALRMMVFFMSVVLRCGCILLFLVELG